jgi:hypothetical protein
MLEIKISELPAATTPLDGTEVFPLVQGIETKKVSINGLFTQANMGTPASIDLTNATNVPGGGITGTVAIAHGGTGATTAANARTNLGVTATGMDTTYLYRANNLSDLGSASSARTNLGLGSAAVLTAGAANGVATLDSSGTVPLSQIPAALQGALNYQGTWNATSNSPTLTSSVGTKGYYYVVSMAGSTNLNGITDWQIGDWAVFNGSIWQKIDNTDAVTSVNGYTGTVVLTQSDISGTVPINKGGTGQTTQQLAINALAGSLTSGYYLRGNGTNVLMSAIQAADVPTLNQNTTGTASNVTGIVAIANGGTGASTAATARTNLGLGTMATQDATGVAITGGTINGTTVGATTPSTGKFTNLEATGTLTGSNGIMAIGTSQIYKDASGNVGFNNIVPAEKIDVVGNIKASGTISAATQFTGPGTGLTGTAASLSIGGNAANVTGIVGATNGGTGQSTVTTGDLLYGSATNTWSKLGIGSTGQVLRVVSGLPAWGTDYVGTVTSVAATVPSFLSISGSPITSSGTLAIGLSGTALPTTSGGTGLTSFTANGVVYASSSSALATGSALTFNGTNLNFGSTAQRITGDFSNATLTNRLAFQTSTANSNTILTVIPNGTAVQSQFNLETDPTQTNGNSFQWIVSPALGEGRLNLGIRGTGTYLPMTFYTGGSERVRVDTSGNVGIGVNLPAAKLQIATASTTAYGLISQTPVVGLTAGNYVNMAYFTDARSTNNDGLRIVNFRDSTGSGTGDWQTSSYRIRRSVDYNDGASGVQEEIVFGNNILGFNTAGSEQMRIDSSGNVGIGATANASAILDAQSTTKGVRMPNMTTTQKNAIASPAAGLIVFDTTLAKLSVYSGSAWQTVTSI